MPITVAPENEKVFLHFSNTFSTGWLGRKRENDVLRDRWTSPIAEELICIKMICNMGCKKRHGLLDYNFR